MTTIETPGSLTEHERLKRLLPKRHATGASGWATESIQMAQAAMEQYDGRKLANRQDYHRFFREVVPELYAECHDVSGASHILGVLIAEDKAYTAPATGGFISFEQAKAQLGFEQSRPQLDGRNGD